MKEKHMKTAFWSWTVGLLVLGLSFASEETVKWDEPPGIIGGQKALQENIHYPEMAVQNGIEGRVLIKVFVDELGSVTKTRIQRTSGHSILDTAAEKALKNTKFKPAVLNSKPLGVWITVPIEYKLK